MSIVHTFRASAGLGAIMAASLLSVSAAAQEVAPDAGPGLSVGRTATNPNLDEWNLVSLNSTDVASANGGSGVKVALLDGVTDCRHTDLTGHCSYTLLSGGTYNYYSNHGTHTAGIIAGKSFGIAPNATILNYAVFDDTTWVATGSKLVNTWRSAYSAGARIASMSFGCSKIALCFSASEVTQMASATQPMLYVKAAGNDGVALGNETILVTSATANTALNRTLLVGSVNVTGTISTFSNRPGEGCLMYSGASACSSNLQWKNHFIVAPGEAIYSTMPGNSYAYMSGTSMATPVVAGAAALLRQRWPSLTAENLAKILLTTATDKGAPGVDPVYGYGLLNIAAAFRANGTVTVQSISGTTTTVTGTTTTTSPLLQQLASALADVTVYDQYGRDFTWAETGSLAVSPNALARRQLLGRRLLGASAMTDWTQSFFADEPQPSGYAFQGSPGDMAGTLLSLDRSSRMGVDLPFKGGLAQVRLTGGGDPRTDFAYDATMRPLANFASTSLLKGALIGSALIRMPGHARLMAYAIATPGAIEQRMPFNPLEMRLTDRGYMPRTALTRNDDKLRRQTGFGLGYWKQAGRNTVVGFNASMISQKGGWYSLTSDLADFDRPTRVLNFGAAVAQRMGDWELTASGELTHLRMATGTGALSFTPTRLVSAEAGVRKAHILAGGKGLSDSFGISFAMPPRAVSGNLRVDYMAPTADGLGRQGRTRLVPVSALGHEPSRAEAAYRLTSGKGWSFSLSGGVNLGDTAGYGKGEAMATFRTAW